MFVRHFAVPRGVRDEDPAESGWDGLLMCPPTPTSSSKGKPTWEAGQKSTHQILWTTESVALWKK